MSAPDDSSTGFNEFLMRSLAPVLGVVTSEFLAIGPLTSVLQCRKEKSLGEVNPYPFPLLFANSVGMVIYSAVIRNGFVFAGNIGPVILSLFYVFSAHSLTENMKIKFHLEILTCSLTLLWLVAGFTAAMMNDQHSRVTIVGVLGNIVVLTLFASPLTTCAHVFRTKNSSSINRPFAYAQVINCIVWLCYGIALSDRFIVLPNFIGLWLGAAQIVLILQFPAPSLVDIVLGAEFEQAEIEGRQGRPLQKLVHNLSSPFRSAKVVERGGPESMYAPPTITATGHPTAESEPVVQGLPA